MKDLEFIIRLVEAGKVKPVFDLVYPSTKPPRQSIITFGKAMPTVKWSNLTKTRRSGQIQHAAPGKSME